jgi:polyferredoxin
MAILTTILVLLLRKKFRKVYCFWICPLGFAQELMGEIKLYRRKSKALKLTVLIILGVCLLLGVFLARPYQPLRDAGILLVGLLIIISILSLLFPQWKPLFGKFKYLSLIFWVGINIRNKISGPWCAIAVANITYPVIVEFIIVLAISLVVHRAWCEYTCPDGGFFELLSGKIKKRQKGKGVE